MFRTGVFMMAAGLAAGGCCTKASHPAHIVDSIGNADKYVGLNPHFKEAFAFLQRPDLAKLAVGRYDLVPGKCWAMIQEPDLHSVFGAKTECHRKYIDIQAPIAREETMGLYTMTDRELALPFDEEKDVVLFEAEFKPVVVKRGEFAIFFPPLGAHAPCCTVDEPGKTKKVVIKVLAE